MSGRQGILVTGTRHGYLPAERHGSPAVGEAGDSIRQALDLGPCPRCRCPRVLVLKLAGARCRGCGHPRELPVPISPVIPEITLP